MDIYHEYMYVYGHDSDEEDGDIYIRNTVGRAQHCRLINVHLPNGFINTMRYVLKIKESTRFNEYDLHQYVTREKYNRDNYSQTKTFYVELNCVHRLKTEYSGHHRQGWLHTCKDYITNMKKMIIRAPRFLTYIIEEIRKNFDVEQKTCVEIKDYILWQHNTLIENSCLWWKICDDRSILTTVVTYY